MARAVPASSSASAVRGIWFVFPHAAGPVALWVSSFTGKEELYVNGAITAQRRKIALNSTHSFELAGSQYVLSLTTRNLRRGVFECVLYKNGQIVAAQQTEYVAKRRWQQSLLVGGASAAFAYLAFTSRLSPLASIAGIAAAAATSFALFGRESGYVIRTSVGSSSGESVERGGGEA